MSQLFFTERGHCLPTLGEEVTRRRRARKTLVLPPTSQEAVLYVLARPHSRVSPALAISVNGADPLYVSPAHATSAWLTVPLPADQLRSGPNTIDIWSDCSAMNGWSLAMSPSPGRRGGGSCVSHDAGATWSEHGMGYAGLASGDYAVRVRLAEGDGPDPPTMVWEQDASLLRDLLQLLPPSLLRLSSRFEQVVRLCSWVSRQWDYYNNSQSPPQHRRLLMAPLPAPWDPATIIAWGKSKSGHNGYRPVVHCVHYTVTFALLCNALGIPARCCAATDSEPQADDPDLGHFVAEVWIDELAKWVMVDPNFDAIAFDDGTPLSFDEARKAGPRLSELLRWGPAHAGQVKTVTSRRWVSNVLARGRWMTYRAIWPRMDFLSRPDLAPAAHGLMAYSETDLVWECRASQHDFGMFPLFAPPAYFDAPPDAFPTDLPG